MRAKDIMTTPVHTVSPDAAVESAAELMTTNSITALPVVDGCRLVGMISEGDLLWHRVPPAVAAGPVLVCLTGVLRGDAVLRFAFAEADRRGTPLHVLVTGPASPAGEDSDLLDLVERWAEKHPAVSVTSRVSRGIDAAVSLTAATRGHCLAVVAEPADATAAAVLHALSRRTHCPVVVVGETTGSQCAA